MLKKLSSLKNVTRISKQQQMHINGGLGGSCFAFCETNNDCTSNCGSHFSCDKWLGICVS